MPIQIELKPIYYPLLQDTEWLPGKRPYFHQKRIYDLILEAQQTKELICIFNRAVTGGGKTLASYAASIRHSIPAIGLYPTNELIEDQERALRQEMVNPTINQLRRIDSEELDRWQVALERKSHQEVLRPILSWHGIMLTNPDIFYYLYFGLYKGFTGQDVENKGFPGLAELLFNLTASYPVMIFDEFHLYNVKQMGNVAFIIASLQELQQHRGKTFIFSSATPNPRFLEILDRLRIRIEQVETEQTDYHHAASRCVSQPLSLTIIPGDLAAWKSLDAIEEHFALIADFLQTSPAAKVVFILDSVAETLRLTQRLRERYPDRSVGEVHGLASDETRKNALQAQFTVGTSTIEVGIDFKGVTEKDLLIFEARTSSQFIQRLGRIARHAKTTEIPNRAIAIVPPYVYNELTARITSERQLERETLYEHIEAAYHNPNDFKGYFTRYSPVEAFSAIRFMEHQQMPDAYETVKERLESSVEVMYEKPIGKIASCFRRLCHEKLIAPLFFFRGSGFNVAFFDHNATGFPLKTYDLLFLLTRTNFQELSSEQFEDHLASLIESYSEEAAMFKKRAKLVTANIQSLLGVYGYFDINGFLEKPRKVWFEIDSDDLDTNFVTEDVTKIQGLTVKTDPPTNLRRLNKLFERKEFVCWASERNASGIRFSKSLPALFQLYELRIVGRTGLRSKNSWSIAFNQNAYFMNCLWFKKQMSDAFIC